MIEALLWLGMLASTAWHRGEPPPTAFAMTLWFLGPALTAFLLGAPRTLADGVTLLRSALLGTVTTLCLVGGSVGFAAWLGIGVALAADGLDGWCARRFGGSEAGAILDMECDQLAFVALALLACGLGATPTVVLLAPALRFVKVVTHHVCGMTASAPRPRGGDNRFAKVASAIATAALWTALAPGLPRAAVLATSLGAVLVLVISYRTDFADLLAGLAERRRARS